MTTVTIIGIILMLVGFALIGLEMVLPGFGLPGITGIISLIVGIVLTAKTVEQGIVIAIISIVILALMLTVIMIWFQSKKSPMPMVLKNELKGTPEYMDEEDMNVLIGKEGVAITDLRPFGKGMFDGVEFSVRSKDARYIDHDKRLEIVGVKENVLLVMQK